MKDNPSFEEEIVLYYLSISSSSRKRESGPRVLWSCPSLSLPLLPVKSLILEVFSFSLVIPSAKAALMGFSGLLAC